MKIVVCIRQGLDGEINPFDACAYEEALKIKGAEVIILSMAPIGAKDFFHSLTRLGAKKAVLLSDKVFAGADTLATAYTLSLAIKKINPDLVFCGRQTLVGDTAQTGPMLSVFADISLITNVMKIESIDKNITCKTRSDKTETVTLPALLTIERINTLRLPSIMSKLGEIEVLNAEDLSADIKKCGLSGSPTRVLKTFENESGKRKCKFISISELDSVIKESLERENKELTSEKNEGGKLEKVYVVGNSPLPYAKKVCENIKVLPSDSEKEIIEVIEKEQPSAVLFGSDDLSKKLAATISAKLELGLCADCTELSAVNDKLIMYRPALSGSIIAKIESLTKPAIATVRTQTDSSDIIVAAGYGVKDKLKWVESLAEKYGAEISATRKMVDNNYLNYSMQVGLTGKKVSPKIYIAVGVSGAVHHIVGMQQSAVVIAINPDKDAPIFDYADFGILEEI